MHTAISEIETAIRRDPARRGLLSRTGETLGLGELQAAAASLASNPGRVVIVTGFYIPLAEPAAAETDGPPGAVALAQTLIRLGHHVSLVTDPFCGSALQAAARAALLPESSVEVLNSAEALAMLIRRNDEPVTHLIAVERVGPCYSRDHIHTRCGEDVAARFGHSSAEQNAHGDFRNRDRDPP